jgi:hypothetical protein
MSSPNEGRIDPEKRRSIQLFVFTFRLEGAVIHSRNADLRHQPSDGRDHERRDIVRKSVWDKRTGKA